MDKEKEIEEMIETLANKHFEANPHEYIADMPRAICSALVEAGYRKSDEVRKETAKEFKETMKYIFRFILKNKGNTSIPYFQAEERVFYKIDREVDREFLQQYGIKADE